MSGVNDFIRNEAVRMSPQMQALSERLITGKAAETPTQANADAPATIANANAGNGTGSALPEQRTMNSALRQLALGRRVD